MSEKQAKVWGIHGGKTGDADTLFLTNNVCDFLSHRISLEPDNHLGAISLSDG